MVKLELNGNWELRDAAGALLCPVTVPGSVISGLYAAGKLAHPYDRENEYAVRELFWQEYQFVRSFDVDEALMAQNTLTLVCEGLDTLAQILINGKVLADTDNMHRTYRFSVKDFLRLGGNEICIVFRSVLRFIEEYPYQENKTIHYIPCGAMKGNQLVRKAHSMFGWDWGPQLVDAGIWRPIYIEGTASVGIEDVRIRQVHEKDGSVRVKTTITLSGAGTERDCTNRKALAVTSSDTRSSMQAGIAVTVALAEKEGIEISKVSAKAVASKLVYEAEIIVQHPKLWWPNGYGEQPLYELAVSVDLKGGQIQRVTKTIGQIGRAHV